MSRDDYLATPWSSTGVPVPRTPACEGPPPLARVDVTRRTPVPAQRAWLSVQEPWLLVR